MKVLLAHNRYRLVGGEDRHVALLRQALDEAGVETRLFEPRSDGLTSSRARRLTAAALSPTAPAAGVSAASWRSGGRTSCTSTTSGRLLTPAALRLSKRAGAAVVLTAHNTRFACPGGTCTIETHPAANGLADNRTWPARPRLRAAAQPPGPLDESLAYGFAQDAQRRLHMLERWVDAIIAPSDYVAEMLELAGAPMDRVTLIRTGSPIRCLRRPSSTSPSTLAGSARRRGSAR